MDCSLVPETFVSKFDIDGKFVYAKISWAYNETYLFRIQLFIDEKSLSGTYSYEVAKSFSESFLQNAAEYAGNVKDALKTSDKFLYELIPFEGNYSEAKFSWKKIYTDSTAKLLHGLVSLQLDNDKQSKDSIIDYLINENKTFQSKIVYLKQCNELLNSEIDKCRSEFEKLVNIKESLESSLYGKFVQLLNSKKRRIRLLENQIATIENAK